MAVRDVSKVPAQRGQGREPGSQVLRTKQFVVVRALPFSRQKFETRPGWGATSSGAESLSLLFNRKAFQAAKYEGFVRRRGRR